MTPEELARPWHTHGGDGYVYMRGGLARVWAGCAEQANAIVEEHNAAVAAERERCARIAETLPFQDHQMNDCRSDDISAAIRTAPGVTP